MHEQRLTTRLATYWDKLRGVSPMPLYAQLNPAVLDDVWKSCCTLKLEPAANGQSAYVYLHCGGQIAEALGSDLTGKRMSLNMRMFPGVKIIKRIEEVVQSPAPLPLQDEGQFVNEKNKIIKYRACLLAFGKPQAVTHVVVGVSWRAF